MKKECTLTLDRLPEGSIYEYLFRKGDVDYYTKYGKFQYLPDGWEEQARKIIKQLPQEQYDILNLKYGLTEQDPQPVTFKQLGEIVGNSQYMSVKGLVDTANHDFYQALFNIRDHTVELAYLRFYCNVFKLKTMGKLIYEAPYLIPEWKDDFGIYNDRIDEALSTIGTRSRTTVRLRFGLDDGIPRSPAEVGKILDITATEVHYIIQNALLHLSGRGCRHYFSTICMNEIAFKDLFANDIDEKLLFRRLSKDFPMYYQIDNEWKLKLFRQLSTLTEEEILLNYCYGNKKYADRICQRLALLGYADPRTGKVNNKFVGFDGYPIECLQFSNTLNIELKKCGIRTVEALRPHVSSEGKHLKVYSKAKELQNLLHSFNKQMINRGSAPPV